LEVSYFLLTLGGCREAFNLPWTFPNLIIVVLDQLLVSGEAFDPQLIMIAYRLWMSLWWYNDIKEAFNLVIPGIVVSLLSYNRCSRISLIIYRHMK
jgi:hypothetical protein